MSASVNPCSVAEIFDNPRCAQLVDEYAKESAIALMGKPAPRRDVYENLEASGMAQCFAAYEGDKLAGFALVLHAVVPHWGLSCATVESIFVEQSARQSGLGTQLMNAIEEHARQLRCLTIFYCAPVGSRLAQILTILVDEYPMTNHVFCKRLQ